MELRALRDEAGALAARAREQQRRLQGAGLLPGSFMCLGDVCLARDGAGLRVCAPGPGGASAVCRSGRGALCPVGLTEHPQDGRCAPDCGPAVFSYEGQACVAPGAPCGAKDGFASAYDALGRCLATDACAPGHVRHPADPSRCHPPCEAGRAFSASAGRCVPEGEPCPRGAYNHEGSCAPDGSPCARTAYPDPGQPTLRAGSWKTSEDLGGAVLTHKAGRCVPTGACSKAGQAYAWARGGCHDPPAPNQARCPDGFSRASERDCVATRAVGGEGSGSTRIDVPPGFLVKASYTFRKDPRWRNGDYSVSGPGISGGAGDVGGAHTTEGSWVAGAGAMTYGWRNNDGSGQFSWVARAASAAPQA